MDVDKFQEFDYTLKSPLTMTISGASQSGKSTLTLELLKRRMDIISPPVDRVLYCYTEEQPLFFSKLRHAVPTIKFYKGLPVDFADGEPMILILDDLMSEISKSTDATNAFTRTSHHQNVSIIYLTQNFFFRGTRTITLNSKYICIMKNPRDSSFLSVLGRQMNGGKKNRVLDYAYKECMKKPFGYLFIDLGQLQDDRYRYRDSIFPEDCSIFVEE
jgi:hypothetical protein